MVPRSRVLASAMAVVSLLVACSETPVVDGHTTTTAPGTGATPRPTSLTTLGTTTTTGSTTTITEPPTITLPGMEVPGVPAGSVLAVIGVAHDDVLNMRSGPSSGYAIVAQLDPLAGALAASGEARAVGSSLWFVVSGAGTTGWVNAAYVAFLGSTDDATSELMARVGSISGTMHDVGLAVVLVLAPEGATVVQSGEASAADEIGEITFDVIGLEDDSVGGMRLTVFGQSIDETGFSLYSVERTWLCLRGVDAAELCV